MKNLFIIGLASLSLFACEKISDLSFSKTVASGTFIIPADYCCGVDQDCDGAVDLAQIAIDNGVSLENIKSITIKSAQLKGIDQDCDAIESINIAATDADGRNINILSKENSAPNGENFLDLDVKSDVNLLTFLKGTTPKFNVTGLLRYKSSNPTKYGLEIKYTMTAQM
jgi:hypothetical protein